MTPITRQFAEQFAHDWIEAWNAHDLLRVLAHYTDDFEMSSPFIVEIAGEASGRLQGKARVAAYWRAALERTPQLRFELIHVLVGVSSVVLFYRHHTGLKSAEALFFNEQGKVERAAAHYCDG
jgi:ketosteroid isomerase-like protein